TKTSALSPTFANKGWNAPSEPFVQCKSPTAATLSVRAMAEEAKCNGRAHVSTREAPQNQQSGPRRPRDWKSLPGTFACCGGREECDDRLAVFLEPQVAEMTPERVEDHAIAHGRLELFDRSSLGQGVVRVVHDEHLLIAADAIEDGGQRSSRSQALGIGLK